MTFPVVTFILMTGFIYDTLGRRLTLFLLIFGLGACICAFPFISPSHWKYELVQIAAGVFFMPIQYAPLNQDFVVRASMGKV